MELLGDMGHVEARFGLFGDIAKLDTRYVYGFVQNIPKARKSFWVHPIELLGVVGSVESRFGPFGDSFSVSAR
jgi:hypothetical protein